MVAFKKPLNCFSNIKENRPFLSIWEVKDYLLRIKTGEKKREIEKKEVLLGLQKMGFNTAVLYKESGQPYLKDNPDLHLSISHSKGWIAIYISSCPIGIDVEVRSPRMGLASSYFTNEREQKFKDNLDQLHIIWGTKEAFYKLQEGNINDLKNEVTITEINQNNSVVLSFKEKEYTFDYYQDDILTIVLS